VHRATRKVVAILNARTMAFAARQVCAPHLDFPVIDDPGNVRTGCTMLNAKRRRRNRC
jgi:hypothetical protein